MLRKNDSPWQYFKQDNEVGICQVTECGKRIKATGGSTSGLHCHLRTKHNINLLKRNHTKKNVDESLSAIISRLITMDDLTFNTISKSYEIRRLLEAYDHQNIPNTPSAVRNTVIGYAEYIWRQIMDELTSYKRKSAKFSLTLDEWTSVRNRQYINISLHQGTKSWNLGLSRIHGKISPESFEDILKFKLDKFNVSFEDIVGCTTDGVSTMCNFGNGSQVIRQFCMARGIQLAILKVFYMNNTLKIKLENREIIDNEDGDISEEDLEDDVGMKITMNSSLVHNFLNPTISELIQKIKVTDILFNKKDNNNYIFRRNVIEKFGKEISLISDLKTSWTSLLEILERFNELKDCILKCVVDLKLDFDVNQSDINLLHAIISVLQPVKVAIESLASPEGNLITADIILKFMLDELSASNNEFSEKLKKEIIDQMKGRRIVYSDVLQFLHNPNEQYSDDYDIFNKTSISTMTKLIIELIEKFNICDNDKKPDDSKVIAISKNVPNSTSSISLKDKLNQTINQKINYTLQNEEATQYTRHGLRNTIDKELKTLREENIRGKHLELAYQYLKTIRPTSIETERAFSAVESTRIKINSKLGDESLDSLCFLKYYFKSNTT